MNPTYYLETRSDDPTYNLAFEEYVLTHLRTGNYLILWQNRNAVIIGRNQNTAEEINSDFVKAHNISVVRRNTGGGAVYHDLGNLNYSFITDAEDLSSRSAQKFTEPVVRVLRGLGLDAESSGRNDILVAGHKVSGTAQQILKGRILHHGTLLFDSNPDMISGALNPDPTKFQSKSVKSVRSRVGNIRSFLPVDMDLNHFWDYLKTALVSESIVPISLSDAQLTAVRALKQEKYDTWQWNYGTSPKYDLCVKRRWSGGLLELRVSIQSGRIAALQIYGDFLALTPIDSLQAALLGCEYRRDVLEQTLSGICLEECLGSITREEFINTLMNQTEAS